MRNTKAILMSVLMIGIVATAVGATLADFSDIEISRDNMFSSGSLDLKVSYMGTLYDDPVPAIIYYEDAMPGCVFDKSFHFDLHNDGQGTQGHHYLYIHFKNLTCADVMKTEPELAVENGGRVIGEKEISPGVWEYVILDPSYIGPPDGKLGEFGEDCNMSKCVWVSIINEDTNEELVRLTMDELVCNQIYLGYLDPGDTVNMSIDLIMYDVPEGALGYDLFPGTDSKWDHWPTNALQKDKMTFDIAFELLQTPPA